MNVVVCDKRLLSTISGHSGSERPLTPNSGHSLPVCYYRVPQQEVRLALIQLLTDTPVWRDDLFDDDEPRLICECKFEITRLDGPSVLYAPILELADALRSCVELALNTQTTATEYLWDTGERVRLSPLDRATVRIELPVGTDPIVIEVAELVGFIGECYSRGMLAFTQIPANPNVC